MGTSELADRGLACFLLNENANILLDRKLMQLGEQRPDSLVFDPSLRNFHEVSLLFCVTVIFSSTHVS